jgi:hypothetical protein
LKAKDFFSKHQKEIEKIFSPFNIVELPGGYLGEISEAINELQKKNIPVTSKNILIYSQAKSKMILYYRGHATDLKFFFDKEGLEPAAGGILPEWVLATATIITIIAGSLDIASKLRKFLTRKLEEGEKKRINQYAEQIINISEVKNLTILVNPKKKKK